MCTDDVKLSHSILVLTEWKKIAAPKSLEHQARKAKRQAERYHKGSLAGFELSNRKYLILVSHKHLTVPRDIIDGELKYRYINVAVNPDSPSVS